MTKNEMLTMIETMNNYDELAAKAKEKAAQRAEQRTIDREKVKVKDRSVQL